MWNSISESILILFMCLGVFIGFAAFESFAFLNGHELFEVRYLKGELIAISVGLGLGVMAGVITDFCLRRAEKHFPTHTFWILLFVGFTVFLVVRIAVQPAS